MAKKRIRFGKLFCTGFLWLLLYVQLVSCFCFQWFGFRILSRADWQHRINDFMSGKWVIDTGVELGLFLSMILFIPLFFVGWYISYKLHWNQLVFRKKRTEMPLPSGQLPPRKTFEPGKLRVQSSAILTVPIGQASSQTVMQGSVDQFNTAQPVVPTSQEMTPAFEDESEVQQILTLIGGIKADFFPHVNLDGHYASFALSTEKKAAVFKVINRPDSTWAVDTEVPVLESDWFYEAGVMSAPAKDVLAVADNLHKNEPDSLAVPVLLLMSGTLLNIEETLDYYEKNDVILLRLPKAEADGVPLFQDFLEDFFGDENATQAVETQE